MIVLVFLVALTKPFRSISLIRILITSPQKKPEGI